jgi:hypothetical protein
MSKTADKSDPKLWDKVKTEVTQDDKGGKPGQWSARKAQMAVQEYKKRGGGYDGGDKEDTSLRTWTKAQSAKASAGSEGNEPGRSELYAEAKKRGIPGRSKMSKEQLRSALKTDAGR